MSAACAATRPIALTICQRYSCQSVGWRKRITLPGGRRSSLIFHRRSSRQSYRGLRAGMTLGRELGDRFPAQDPNGDTGRRLALGFGLVEAATDDPQPQLVLVEAVDGRVGHRAELLERLVLVVGHARRIADQQGEENERARRQRGHPLQHLVERQVVEPGEAHAVVEGLERLLKDRRPEPLERGGADHDGDVVRVGRELENVLDQAREVERLADEGGVALERVVPAACAGPCRCR